jgi:hypothetical protein
MVDGRLLQYSTRYTFNIMMELSSSVVSSMDDPWYTFHQEHFGDEQIQWFKQYLLGNLGHENNSIEVIVTPQTPPRPSSQRSTFPAPEIELSEEMHHFLYQNALRRARSRR